MVCLLVLLTGSTCICCGFNRLCKVRPRCSSPVCRAACQFCPVLCVDFAGQAGPELCDRQIHDICGMSFGSSYHTPLFTSRAQPGELSNVSGVLGSSQLLIQKSFFIIFFSIYILSGFELIFQTEDSMFLIYCVYKFKFPRIDQ